MAADTLREKLTALVERRLRRDARNYRVLAESAGCDPELSRRCHRLADYASGVIDQLAAILAESRPEDPAHGEQR